MNATAIAERIGIKWVSMFEVQPAAVESPFSPLSGIDGYMSLRILTASP